MIEIEGTDKACQRRGVDKNVNSSSTFGFLNYRLSVQNLGINSQY